MMKTNKFDPALYFIVFLLTYVGYYSILLLLFNLGMGDVTRTITIPIRLLIITSLVILFFNNIKKIHRQDNLRWFLLFSLFYIARLLVDYLSNETYYIGVPEVMIFFLSFVFLPFVIISSIRLDTKKINAIFSSLWLGGIVFSVLVVVYYGRFIGQVSRLASNTVGESVISPLSLSYSSSIIIGIFVFYLLQNKTTFIRKIGLLVGIGLSTVPFFLGASRGSLVALFIPFVLYFFSGKNINFRIRGILSASVVFMGLIYLDSYFQSGLLNRFLGTSEAIERGESSAVRIEIWKGAFDQFFNNPVFGDKLRIDKWPFGYAHNLFVEVLQTTGLLGFIPFTVLVFKAWKISFYILRYHKPYFWVAVIFIQSFFMNMFSGAIYTAAWFWSSMALLFAMNNFLKYRQNKILQ